MPPVHSLERTTCAGQEEDTTPAQESISAHTSYSYSDDLTRAAQRNIELLENLLSKLTPSKPGIRLNSPEERFGVRRGRWRPIVCLAVQRAGPRPTRLSGKRAVAGALGTMPATEPIKPAQEQTLTDTTA